MATTKKTTTKEVEVKDEIKTQEETFNLEDVLKIVQELQESNKQLKQELENKTVQPVVIKNDEYRTKKIKCVSLVHNPINVFTGADASGKPFSFDKYGDSRLIKFDELSDIIASYPNTMEQGLIYICDMEAVKELGLEEAYEKIYTKDMIDRLIYLREESDVDLLLGMNENMFNSTLPEIAKLLNANETIDLNFLARIKTETGHDIKMMADKIREESEVKE